MKMNDAPTPDVSFRIRPMGFDKQEVRAFIANILEDYEKAKRELSRLEERAASEPRTEDPLGPDTMMRDLQRILGGAHRVADDIEARATEDSQRKITEANARAVDVLAAAERQAAEITAQARRDVTTLEQRARSLREQIVKLRAAFEAASDTAAMALSDMAAVEAVELPAAETVGN
jgi:hypothetical protein